MTQLCPLPLWGACPAMAPDLSTRKTKVAGLWPMQEDTILFAEVSESPLETTQSDLRGCGEVKPM